MTFGLVDTVDRKITFYIYSYCSILNSVYNSLQGYV